LECGDFGNGNAFTFAWGILPAIRLTGRKVCILAWSVVGSLGDTAAVNTIARLIRPDWIDTVAPRTLSTINDLDRRTFTTTVKTPIDINIGAATVATWLAFNGFGTDKKLVIAVIAALSQDVKTLLAH
jgi:hypothetical protein